ncbi:hypothetical protein CHS0354_041769 [Potamilus streckersoni]|uniref:Major facilitator superfamily associated domain-containing protein n=1 Tax=Potamilus streckersoni TaxID=2493646 RepID=A0AAE0W534_9BIVA|nr:hypothetical protein CHS0354_041769 [Potamilus streckersoni]
MDVPEPVNLSKSVLLCNVYHFLFAAGKACLLPFLTVYFKILGLTAMETGFVIGGKTFTALIFAPLWARCATQFGRRRCMLMFSLFIMAATYLSLTAVPSIDTDSFATKCTVTNSIPNLNSVQQVHYPDDAQVSMNDTLTTKRAYVTKAKETSPIFSSTIRSVIDSNESHVTESILQTTSKTLNDLSSTRLTMQTAPAEDPIKEILMLIGYPPSLVRKLNDVQAYDILEELLSTSEGLKSLKEKLPKELLQTLIEGMAAQENGRGKRNVWTSIKTSLLSKLEQVKNKMRETKHFMFVAVLVIMLVGEIFSSPVEKLADDSWYEFLESIDDLEKYGMQRVWSSFGYILLPVTVALVVDNTNCLFGLSMHPFLFHFYMFGGFMGLTFVVAFFYPMTSLEKYRYGSKVKKGLQVICCKGRNLLFTFTLFILGIVYASYNNFLFWMLIDMKSKELTLGLCVTFAALSEIPMLLFSQKFVQQIGNAGVVAVALAVVSARTLYYSFLWTPWAVLPVELTHAFTHTALWWAVLSSPSFKINPAVDRSVRSVLSSVYFGLGFGVGSIVSGVVYDIYGAAVFFRAAAVTSTTWLLILLFCSKCCCPQKNKSNVKYQRLLANDNDSDDSTTMEDDWLEQALREK